MIREDIKNYNLILINEVDIIGTKKDLYKYYKQIELNYINNKYPSDGSFINNIFNLLDDLKKYKNNDILKIEYQEQGKKSYKIIKYVEA